MTLFNTTRKILAPLARITDSTFIKEVVEYSYWRIQKFKEGRLSNAHYAHFYTQHFNIPPSFYNHKTVLDVGCGPRGSLEWITTPGCAIGVDPLAHKYKRLRQHTHSMRYLNTGAEYIPIKSKRVDILSSFNSLDHVSDPIQCLTEFKRLLQPGATLLIIVEVNHPPTFCEPHSLSPPLIIDTLGPEFAIQSVNAYKPRFKCIWKSIRANQQFDDPHQTEQTAFFSAHMTRR